MIDPVAIIKDIAEAAGYKFIYGGSAYANYELTSLGDLTDESIVVFMFPFIENAEVVQSGIDGFTLDTIISIGRKSEATTYSNLDETEKQKYDRRLKDLKAYLVSFVQSVLCNSDFELNSLRIDSTLNRFNENLDTVNGQLTLRYSNSSTGTGYDITPPLPDQIEWENVTNKPSQITNLSGTNTGDQDLSDYALLEDIPDPVDLTDYLKKISPDIAMITGSGNAPTSGEGIKTQFLTSSKTALIQVINALTGAYSTGGLSIDVKKLLLLLSGIEIARAEDGLFSVKALKILNSVFSLNIPSPVTGDMMQYNGTDWVAVKRVGFSARDGRATIPASTWTDVSFQIEDEDTDDSFNGTTWTVPAGKGGLYFAAGHLTLSAIDSGKVAIVGLSVNGINPGSTANNGGLFGRGVGINGGLGGYGGGLRIFLNAGDVVKMQVYCANTTGLYVTKGYNTFSVYKMIP